MAAQQAVIEGQAEPTEPKAKATRKKRTAKPAKSPAVTNATRTQVPAPVDQVANMQSMMASAIEAGHTPETIGKLVDQLERMIELQARQQMTQALNAFHSKLTPVPHNASFPTRYKRDDGKWVEGTPITYSNFPAIARHIAPLILECGLSYDFEVETIAVYPSGSMMMKGNLKIPIDGRPMTLRVTCHLRHVGGGVHSSTFDAIVEYKPGQNPSQSVAMARSYGCRYSLLQVTGMSTEESPADDREGDMAKDGHAQREEPSISRPKRQQGGARHNYRTRDECVEDMLRRCDAVGLNAEEVAQAIGLEHLSSIESHHVEPFLAKIEEWKDG